MEIPEGFSPEHIATLMDLAEKISKRKARTAISGAVVKRHDWTPEERKLVAAKNDLRSAQIAYEKTRIAAERANEAFGYADRDLRNAEERLKEAIEAAEAAEAT